MDALYARFVKPGDLAFDIGSHVGDRIGSFRRFGARVVALEPQPLCARAIRAIYAGDADVTLIEAACGARAGHADAAHQLRQSHGFDRLHRFHLGGRRGRRLGGPGLGREIEVPCTTLDALIAQHGAPAFAKIDVEGFEDTVLAGLSRPLPVLSFEFTTIQRDVALRCLDRLASLGPYGFDVALGESQALTFNRWISKADMAAHIAGLPHAANSGDVYCVLQR